MELVASAHGLDDDTPKEACGVFGIYGPGQPVAHLTYAGLFALQHRGQESAGMAVSDGDTITVVKNMGLVTNAFDERTLAPLQGHVAIGHVRYSTTGSSTWSNAQPIYRSVGDAGFALGHNGNLVNVSELAGRSGVLADTLGSDSDLVAELLQQAVIEAGEGARSDGRDLERALIRVLPDLQGAFSLVLMDDSRVIGVRDPNGFRPLCLGRLDTGWVLASETPALDIVGAHFVRELDPGEMVVLDATGVRSFKPFPPERLDPKLCLFEFVYFARPDSNLYGQSVHRARQSMGERLAEQAPLPPDDAVPAREAMVMPVPESGIPAAEGYARASGIPFGHGLVKNRYIGRTFIAPSQDKRAQAVRMKLNPIRDNIAGKRLVVVDDSIVRGTTTRAMVAMLREAGAQEVHLRISSPPYRWPCYFGMDTGSRGELLAADLTVPEVREYLGCDTLAYLDLDRLVAATGSPGSGFCTACLTGEYPVDVKPGRVQQLETREPRPESEPQRDLFGAPLQAPTLLLPVGETYASAGVDIGAGEEAVQRIKERMRSTFRPEVLGDVGGFGGLFAFDPRRYHSPVLVSSTDGVGTKAMVARAAGRFETIGIDLVAMCVDDIATHGAEPLFFLDYVAVGQLDPGQVEKLVGGVIEGCQQAGCSLIAGEMAEHPGAMEPGEFDLVGFAVGVVERDRLVTGDTVQPGHRVIGLPSPGLRCNGYSLARRVLLERAGRSLDDPAWPGAHHTLGEELLRPPVIYAPALVALCRAVDVGALAHITGSGLPGNLARVLPRHCDAVIDTGSWSVPPIFAEIERLGEVAPDEMARVFNLGIGMVAVVAPDDVFAAHDALRGAGVESCDIGEIVPGGGAIRFA